MSEPQPSKRLVDQRLRNRLIEQLGGLAAGDEEVRRFGAHEYFESFFDFVPSEGSSPYPNSSLTAAESEALSRVIDLMNQACNSYNRTPKASREFSDEDLFIQTAWPARIAAVAKPTLEIFLQRGRFSEECEQGSPDQ